MHTQRRHSPHRTAWAGVMLCCVTPLATAAVTFNGNATLTNDYIWRGSSQTQGHAATQAGLKAALDYGSYVAWSGSSVYFGHQSSARTELDLIAGWSHNWSQRWNSDINLTRYTYPGSTTPLNWNEWGVTWSWNNTLWLQAANANHVFASRFNGTFAQLGFRYPLSDGLRFEVAAEHYWLPHAYAEDYSDELASVVWSFNQTVALRLTGHLSDHAAKQLYGNQARSRLEIALQATF